jgi:hypothetical protein
MPWHSEGGWGGGSYSVVLSPERGTKILKTWFIVATMYHVHRWMSKNRTWTSILLFGADQGLMFSGEQDFLGKEGKSIAGSQAICISMLYERHAHISALWFLRLLQRHWDTQHIPQELHWSPCLVLHQLQAHQTIRVLGSWTDNNTRN